MRSIKTTPVTLRLAAATGFYLLASAAFFTHCGKGWENFFSGAELSQGLLTPEFISTNPASTTNESAFTWRPNRHGSYNIEILPADTTPNCGNGKTSSGDNASGLVKAGQNVTAQILAEDLEIGRNTIVLCYTSDHGILAEHGFEITRDDTPPITQKSHPAGAYSDALEIELSCQDDNCDRIIYTLDETEPRFSEDGEIENGILYTNPISPSDLSTTRIRFKGIDLAGNVESASSASYSLDTTIATLRKKEPEMVSGSSGYSTNTVTWRSNQSDRPYRVLRGGQGCFIGDGTEIDSGLTTGSNQSFAPQASNLSVGKNTYYICIETLFGFYELPVDVVRDDTPPEISVEPINGAFSDTVTIEIGCADNCDIIATTDDSGGPISDPGFNGDGSIANGSESPTSFSPPSGDTVYRFRAIDKASNVSSVHESSYSITLGLPNITTSSISHKYLSALPTGYQNTTIKWSSDITGFPYKVQIDETDCTGSSVLSGATTPAGTITSVINQASLTEGTNIIRICVENSSAQYGYVEFAIVRDSTIPDLDASNPVSGSTSLQPNFLTWTLQFSEELEQFTEDNLALKFCTKNCETSAQYTQVSFTGIQLITTSTVTPNDTIEVRFPYTSLPENSDIRLTIKTGSLQDLAGNDFLSDYDIDVTTTIRDLRFPIADTGQTICYQSDHSEWTCFQTRQDGESQNTPNARFFSQAFTSPGSPGDWLVQDFVTGFTWALCVQGSSGQECLGDNPTRLSWSDAFQSCQNLNSGNGFGGRQNWRLPNAYELSSLVNYANSNPALDTVFVNVPSDKTWTLSSDLNKRGRSWDIDFNLGNSGRSEKTELLFARCVSEPQTLNPYFFIDNEDGTVSDTIGGLMWQTCPLGQSYNSGNCDGSAANANWFGAIIDCNSLILAGFNDWRMPSINEMRSLILRSEDNPAISETLFPDVSSPYIFWTSTTYETIPSLSWGIDFGAGQEAVTDKSFTGFTRCVR